MYSTVSVIDHSVDADGLIPLVREKGDTGNGGAEGISPDQRGRLADHYCRCYADQTDKSCFCYAESSGEGLDVETLHPDKFELRVQ